MKPGNAPIPSLSLVHQMSSHFKVGGLAVLPVVERLRLPISSTHLTEKMELWHVPKQIKIKIEGAISPTNGSHDSNISSKSS